MALVVHLARVVGRRPFVAFGLVTLVVVFLLAAINVTSRYALAQYVDDQLARVPWDVSLYQISDLPLAPEVRQQVARVPHVLEAQSLVFLRTQVPTTTLAHVDGQPMRSPWLSVLAATDPALLPPDIRPATGRSVLVLAGSKAQMGDAYLQLQDRKRFELRLEHHGRTSLVFEAPVERTVRIERDELNRWFMDQTSSPTMVPELGVILVTPYDPELLLAFDGVSRGLEVHVHGDEDESEGMTDLHAQPGEYFPEVIHLARLDRAALVSGWDVERSFARLQATGESLRKAAQAVSFRVALDNTAGVLLERMSQTAQVIGLISLLVALPLIWMAGVLLANLSGLLLLNERRTFGLLRLRGVPGALLGRSVLLAIGAGGLVGGLVGGLAGTALPLLVYARGWLPWEVVLTVQPPGLLLGFVLLGVGLALLVARRFARLVASISPLEASGRVAAVEATGAALRFGPLEALALVLGGLKVLGWIAGWSLAALAPLPWLPVVDRALDFVAFPLFVYGVTTLLASRWSWLARLLGPAVRLLGGTLGELSLRHMATRPHRVAGYLLIVALMASISLYPTIMTAVFDNKTERGARVQVGTPLQVTLNAPDLVPAASLARGGLAERYGTLRTRLEPLVADLERLDGVASVDYLVEGLVEGLYMRGYGFNGVPIYLVDRPERYLRTVYHEEALGENGSFRGLIDQLGAGQVLISPALAAYWQRAPGEPMPVGRDVHGEIVSAALAGSVRFLPGMPLTSVNDRESFVSVRIDYLNHLFSNRAYLVASARNPALANIDLLIPRVVLTVQPRPGANPAELERSVLGALPAAPLEVRGLETEIGRLGSDMYVFLARQNVQIYLLGGLLLALIGIVAVALSNYAEDRRTLALLRVRGCGPGHLLRFFSSCLFAPAGVGLLLGAGVSLVVGYGITNLIWELWQLRTILSYLPTQLAVSQRTMLIAVLLIVLQIAIGLLLSRWVFRRTAREGLGGG